MKTHVMSFSPDGTVRTLWTDALPLATLGPVKVERASQIEFNNSTRRWEVRFADTCAVDGYGPVVYSSYSRHECVNWEVRTITEKL